MSRPIAARGVALLAAIALGVAACSSSSTAAPTAAPTLAAPTSPPVTATLPPAATAAATSMPAASAAGEASLPPVSLPSGIPSFAIPSFNADKDLEAQLPSEFCGEKTMKLSFAGEQFFGQAQGTGSQAFSDVLGRLGKTPADVSVAVAAVESGTCTGTSFLALRIKGADQGQFEQLFAAAQQQETGVAPTKTNLGGKDVWAYQNTSGDVKQWIYFKGDTAFGVTATSEADAGKALALLP